MTLPLFVYIPYISLSIYTCLFAMITTSLLSIDVVLFERLALYHS